MVGLAGCSLIRTRDDYAPVWSSSVEAEAFKKNNQGKKSYYVVKPGDTLYSIGFIYKLDYRNLARWNNMVPPYKLEEGNRLRLYAYTPNNPIKIKETKKGVKAVIEKEGSSYKISKIETVDLDKLKAQEVREAAVKISNEKNNQPYTVSETEQRALERLKEDEARKEIIQASNEKDTLSYSISEEEQRAISRLKEKEKTTREAAQNKNQKSDAPLKVTVADKNPIKTDKKQEVKGETSGKNRDPSQKLPRVERPSSQIKPTPKKPRGKVIKSVWQWPIGGEIIKNFAQTDKMGLDIGGKAGQKVKASASGKVVYSGPSGNKYGNLLIIKHNASFISAYAHNNKLFVKEGVVVNQGQVIAEVGDGIGQSKALLHFEIRKDGKSVNPLGYLPKR
jgi:lipoprotein NlpD